MQASLISQILQGRRALTHQRKAKGKQPAAQKNSTRTTRQAPTTQPALLAADFAAALAALPHEDWSRIWAAGKTIMLIRTSKRVKEVVDKMRLPTVVRLSRSFWDDTCNGTEKEKRQFVLRQLTAMTAQCSITTLELRNCAITGPHAEWLAGGVLAQCRALVHLDLRFSGGSQHRNRRDRESCRSTGAVRSGDSGKGGFEVRGVVKPLASFWRRCRYSELLGRRRRRSLH